MRDVTAKRHLRLVVSGVVIADVSCPPPPPPPAASTITIEIGCGGALQKLEVNVRQEDALQALQGLVMAHLRALDLLTH
jgi:hypothetical protein